MVLFGDISIVVDEYFEHHERTKQRQSTILTGLFKNADRPYLSAVFICQVIQKVGKLV